MAAFGGRGGRRAHGGGKRGRDTKVSLPLLTPQPFLRTRLPSVARLNARGPQMRLVLQGATLDRSGAFRRGTPPPCTVWPRTVMRGKSRKVNSGHNSIPKSARRPEPSPRFSRFAAHLRCVSAKEGKGSQEGTGNHTWCPVPFCPPPWARRLRRRRRPMLTPSEGVKSPPAASRCIGGTACRQRTVKRKKTAAEGIRKRLPFVKRAFFSCFTSAYAADFRNYSSTFT